MATDEPIEPPGAGQLLHQDIKNHVRRRVGREVEEMIDSADELRGLAASLDGFSSLETRASPGMLRETAVGVRAVAMQAFISACRAAGISARLHSWADIVGIVDPPDDEPEGKAE
jgi:hypothetical protein